jgi:autotransporter-associated beta strand protein
MAGGAKIDTTSLNITVAQPLINGGGSDGGLNKSGAGVLTLAGTNTYNGNTMVNAGALSLGTAGSIANSAKIGVAGGAQFDISTVAGGFTLGAAQTLFGVGTVNGPVTSQGIIEPGFPFGSVGALTFNNPPVLNGMLLMNVDRNNGSPLNGQVVLPSGILNYGGTLTVANIGAPLQAGDVFQLFSAPSYSGNFTVTNLPSLNSGLVWSNSLAINGSISVISTVSLVPTNVSWGVDGANLTLSWPADHTGWRLQVQTNSLSAGLGTNWFDVAGSTTTNSVNIPMDATQGSVFYRLVYP